MIVRPIWLLDIDGVINAVMDPAKIPDDHTRLVTDRYSIVYRQVVVDRIALLHKWGRVEVRWLTTWLDSAPELGDRIGLPRFAVEGRGDWLREEPGSWWKSVTAQRISEANPDSPLIWTDDDLEGAADRGEVEWLADRTAPTLALSPNWRTGLSDAFLDRIEAFELLAAASLPSPEGN